MIVFRAPGVWYKYVSHARSRQIPMSISIDKDIATSGIIGIWYAQAYRTDSSWPWSPSIMHMPVLYHARKQRAILIKTFKLCALFDLSQCQKTQSCGTNKMNVDKEDSNCALSVAVAYRSKVTSSLAKCWYSVRILENIHGNRIPIC